MLKKIMAGLFLGGALLIAQPMVMTDGFFAPSVAEAGVVNTHDGLFSVSIDDSSVYMVGRNHAHVAISYKNNMKGAWVGPKVVDVMWGAGYACNDLATGKQLTPSDVGLAVANYMSEHY
ncbi:MAG: hypothetical protein K6C05_02825 [Anaerovibrio sp.]|uniref:hypothetical protein n=1 Tax=Anaerovibrio sp. TaxID=1872532 RepID=UPI0025FAA58A|nr:hypothetical protein [Anaerovibrio sp.]MCR5175764.1 hypothetical protein [Anaerovibrio sp.]